MSIIYEPKGRAREYSALAANLYRGCSHGCRYCYVPTITYQTPEEFHSNPTPRTNILEQLKKDTTKFTGRGPVLLCFTCDPYQPIEERYGITRAAIQILHSADIPVTILTKGGRRAERDFSLLGPRDSVGASLTFINKHDSLEWEPYAALPQERIDMLKHAKEQGLRTWASIEPVIDPEQSLALIRETAQFVDIFKVGKLNHHPLAEKIDWRDFGLKAVKLLRELNKPFYIKRDLRAYLTNQVP